MAILFHYKNNFVYVDRNNDNRDFTEVKFDKFIRPFDLNGENDENRRGYTL